jgi:Dyp-type peroxidase family
MNTATIDAGLEAPEIQGDSLAGFRKDHVLLVALRFDATKLADVRRWLAQLADSLAYVDVVHAFNAAFSKMRRLMRAEPPLSALWTNIALTAEGLELLAPKADVATMDASFLAGAAANANVAGDPMDGSPGDPKTWMIGRRDQHVHALLNVAGDDAGAVRAHADALIAQVKGFATVVVEQRGDVRTAQPGHEHFGFKDGISQPGVRGLDDSGSTPLLWPGEYILGYPRKVTGSNDPDETIVDPVAAWMKNGSYVVFRCLRQDVPGFRKALDNEATRLAALPGYGDMTSTLLGALLVGRWPSGSPVVRSPKNDDGNATNDFTYASDAGGTICPFSAHVRKVNPRDEITEQGSAIRTLEHRILRRGVPYGPDWDAARPESANEPRGLLFICHQSSIRAGFEFLSRNWANSPDAPHDGSGQDLIVGQDGGADRTLTLQRSLAVPTPITIKRFVFAVGALYLFAPSRSALKMVLGDPGAVK